jgi:hypothetical protein
MTRPSRMLLAAVLGTAVAQAASVTGAPAKER